MYALKYLRHTAVPHAPQSTALSYTSYVSHIVTLTCHTTAVIAWPQQLLLQSNTQAWPGRIRQFSNSDGEEALCSLALMAVVRREYQMRVCLGVLGIGSGLLLFLVHIIWLFPYITSCKMSLSNLINMELFIRESSYIFFKNMSLVQNVMKRR